MDLVLDDLELTSGFLWIMCSRKKELGGSNSNSNKELHMFVWSSSASPVSDVFGNGTEAYNDAAAKDVRVAAASPRKGSIPFDCPSHSRQVNKCPR